MGREAVLTAEEKIRVVTEYLSGERKTKEFTSQYGIHHRTLYEWAKVYQRSGAAGLYPTDSMQHYPEAIKLSAVKDYLEGKGSISDICVFYGIKGTSTLRRWLKWYNSQGNCKQPTRGGVTRMTESRKTTLDERIEMVSHCIANNKDYYSTSKQYGVSYQQIYGWVRKYEKNGAEGLADRRGKRKAEAPLSDLDKLRAQLKLKEAENLRLQMENELLKKLEALERG
jgi:transposase-like protein